MKITKTIEKAIKIMSDSMYKNSSKDEKGFLVSCVFIKEDKIIIYKNNQRENDKTTNYKNHAEYLCLKKVSDVKEQILIKAIITLPPCLPCLEEMKKITNIKWEIYYLNDAIREKSKKIYIKENESFIKKLYVSKFKIKDTRLRFLYCVDSLISGFLNHWKKRSTEDKKEIIKKHHDHKIKLKKYLRSLRISGGQTSTNWLKEFNKENRYRKI